MQEPLNSGEQDYTQDTGNTIKNPYPLENKIILKIQVVQEPLSYREQDYTQDTGNTRTLIL